MEQVLEDMETEMRSTFRDELEIFYRMSGVFIQMLMYDAEKQSSAIRADVNFMENYKALEDMKAFEELVVTQDFTLVKKGEEEAHAKKLAEAAIPPEPTVKIETVVVKDETVEEENKALQRKVTELEARLESVDLGEGSSANGTAAASSSSTTADGETKRLQSELAAAQEQLEMKVN